MNFTGISGHFHTWKPLKLLETLLWQFYSKGTMSSIHTSIGSGQACSFTMSNSVNPLIQRLVLLHSVHSTEVPAYFFFIICSETSSYIFLFLTVIFVQECIYFKDITLSNSFEPFDLNRYRIKFIISILIFIHLHLIFLVLQLIC